MNEEVKPAHGGKNPGKFCPWFRGGGWHIFVGFFLAAGACASLACHWPNGVSWGIALGIYAYILLLLLEASQRAQSKSRWKIPFPSKLLSILLLLFLASGFVCSFGRMYIETNGVADLTTHECLRNPLDAAYFSAVTITTLGYGDYRPTNSPARKIVIWELGSGVLLLLVAFPILASRLAAFPDEAIRLPCDRSADTHNSSNPG